MKGTTENPRLHFIKAEADPVREIITPEYLLELLEDPCNAPLAIELAHRVGYLDGTFRRGTNPLQMINELHDRLTTLKTSRAPALTED